MAHSTTTVWEAKPWKGYNIYLTVDHMFMADADARPIHRESYADICEAIDNYIVAKEAQAGLGVPVFTRDGKKAHVTGMDSKTSRLTGPGINDQTVVIFPCAAGVKDDLDEAVTLTARLNVIYLRLRPFEMVVNRGGGARRFACDDERCVHLIGQFEKEAAHKGGVAVE